MSRRVFLGRAASTGVVLGAGALGELLAQGATPVPGGEWLGNLSFAPEPEGVPLGRPIADGLDARLLTDLSRISPERLVTPPVDFYVRTARPDRLEAGRPWKIRLGGRVLRPLELSPAELEPRVEDQGLHLMECAGNSRFVRFGLMGVGHWAGVPLEEALSPLVPRPGADWVRVSGFDGHSRPSTNSQAGCSWIFRREQLSSAGAFLATRLGGAPLSGDHGFPVRLMVPGWYGCCAVKWVEKIELVDGGERATSQMREFAERTHQDGVPELAADYRPAVVRMAAMPIRVEKWRAGGRLLYRVVGIQWGGERSTDRLGIRFTLEDPVVPVSEPPEAGVSGRWVLWSHLWRPPRPGRYLIQPVIADPTISSPRMASGYYLRGVEIEEV